MKFILCGRLRWAAPLAVYRVADCCCGCRDVTVPLLLLLLAEACCSFLMCLALASARCLVVVVVVVIILAHWWLPLLAAAGGWVGVVESVRAEWYAGKRM